jgi:hypothetical protein
MTAAAAAERLPPSESSGFFHGWHRRSEPVTANWQLTAIVAGCGRAELTRSSFSCRTAARRIWVPLAASFACMQVDFRGDSSVCSVHTCCIQWLYCLARHVPDDHENYSSHSSHSSHSQHDTTTQRQQWQANEQLTDPIQLEQKGDANKTDCKRATRVMHMRGITS